MKVFSDDAHTACNGITDETHIHTHTHTHTHTRRMLPALLIRCTTVDTQTQHYLELKFVLAETTQTAHKSP